MADGNREILLRSRPVGEPTAANFEIVDRPIPEPGDGEVLVRNLYLSVDPYMRGRMRDVPSYVPPFVVGQVLEVFPPYLELERRRLLGTRVDPEEARAIEARFEDFYRTQRDATGGSAGELGQGDAS